MIDLTGIDVNNLINKHNNILSIDFSEISADVPNLAYIFEESLKYVNLEPDLTVNLKIWSLFVIRNDYFNNRIKNNDDIIKRINKFIKYWNKDYDKYLKNIASYYSDYDRDISFVNKYLKFQNKYLEFQNKKLKEIPEKI